MANGGARPGAGAKKNQHRIHVGELRQAMETALGMPYVEMLAQTQVKLYNDFKKDINVREYVRFTETIADRLIEKPVTEVSVTNPIEELSNEEIQNRINNLMTRQALAHGDSETDAQDGNEENQTS